jgi:two-component system sensor histidine kinase QseC
VKRARSLQARLLIGVLGSVLVLWLAAAVGTWFDARHELDELLDSHLAQSAALLIARQIDADDDDAPRDTPLLHRYAPKVAFQVWHEGRLAMRSAQAPTRPMAPQRSGFATLAIDGRDWRVFAARGSEHDVLVYVGERLDSRADILRAVMRGVLSPVLVALPLLAAALWWAVRSGLLPLRSVAAELERRAPHDLRPLAPQQAPAELVPLLNALNALFERIDALVQTERRFTADAAHELRTPIAAIRAQAQAALGAAQRPERDHALQATIAGCDRATRLVEQLLLLARLDARVGTGEPAPGQDLVALTRRVAAELAPLALARDQELEVRAGGPCTVAGEPELLAAMLRNLIDNALRYTPDAGRAAIVVEPTPAGVIWRVEDSGSGLDDEQRSRLGERFFRVLGSGQPGSGLGWSIVRRIAERSGARVRLGRSASLGGLQVELVWPRAAAC